MMTVIKDSPATDLFSPLALKGNISVERLARRGISEEMVSALEHIPKGSSICWGISFQINRPVLIRDEPVQLKLKPVKAQWLVFLHTSDRIPSKTNKHGFISPMQGEDQLGENAADYVIVYPDTHPLAGKAGTGRYTLV